MKIKYIILLVSGLLLNQIAQSQVSERKWKVGVGAGMVNYYGDLSYRFINAKESQLGYTLMVERSLSSGFSLRLSYLYGTIEGSDRRDQLLFKNDIANNKTFSRALNFKADFHDANIYVVFSFDNGKILSKYAKVSPYFIAGFGIGKFNPYADLLKGSDQQYFYWSDLTIRNLDENDPLAASAEIIALDGTYETNLADLNLETNYDLFKFQIPLGIGLKFRLSELLLLQIETQFVYTFTDYLDDVSDRPLAEVDNEFKSYAYNPSGLFENRRGNLNNNLNDGYLYTSASLVFSFGKKKSKFDGLKVTPFEPVFLFGNIEPDSIWKDSISLEVDSTSSAIETMEVQGITEKVDSQKTIKADDDPRNIYGIEINGGTVYFANSIEIINNNGQLVERILEKDSLVIGEIQQIDSLLTDSMITILVGDSIQVDTMLLPDSSLIKMDTIKMDTITVALSDTTEVPVDTLDVINNEMTDSILIKMDTTKTDKITVTPSDSTQVTMDSLDGTIEEMIDRLSIITVTDSLGELNDSIQKVNDIESESKTVDTLNLDKSVEKDTTSFIQDSIKIPENKRMDTIILRSDNNEQYIDQLVLELKSELHQQKIADSINYSEILQKLRVIEDSKNNAVLFDSLFAIMQDFALMNVYTQSSILDSIQKLKIESNKAANNFIVGNDSAFVDDVKDARIKPIVVDRSLNSDSARMQLDSLLYSNERDLINLQLDYTNQINKLRLELEQKLQELNQELSKREVADSNDQFESTSRKVVSNNSYNPGPDTSKVNLEILQKLNQLESLVNSILSSEDERRREYSQESNPTNTNNNIDYTQRIDVLENAMIANFERLLSEIRTSQLTPINPPNVDPVKVDLIIPQDLMDQTVEVGSDDTLDLYTLLKNINIELDSMKSKSSKTEVGSDDELYEKIVTAFDAKMEVMQSLYDRKLVKIDSMIAQEKTVKPVVSSDETRAVKLDVPSTVRIFFKVNQSTFSNQYYSSLQIISDYMYFNKASTVIIKGFSDPSGNADYNAQLSLKRAEKVKEVLIRNFNIEPSRITVVGLGEEISANANAEYSRRVEVSIQ